MRAQLLLPALLLAAPLSSASAAEPKSPSPAAKTRVLELAIDGMVTDNCPALVKTAVGKLPGVTAAIVKLLKSQVGVDAVVVRDDG